MSHNRANDLRTGGRGTVKGRQKRTMRPTLMMLEDRRLLSTFTVNSTGDDVNTTGTLRWAVAQADAATSPSTIDFNLGASPATITLSNGVLDLSNASDAITITGPGAGVTVNGGGQSGVFQVDPGVTASLSGLTITGGSASYFGGGVYNKGTVTLTGCTSAATPHWQPQRLRRRPL